MRSYIDRGRYFDEFSDDHSKKQVYDLDGAEISLAVEIYRKAGARAWVQQSYRKDCKARRQL